MHRRPPPVHPCDPSGRSYNSEREVAEFKKRQQIRENSVEIRELETKLRQGYINQELAVQKKQKETLAFQLKQDRLLEGKLIEAQRKEVLQEEKETEKKEMLEKIKFKRRLDTQIDEKQTRINKAYEDFLREKSLIDEIIAEVKAEERKKKIETMVKKEVEQEEIEHFIESQKIFVEREKERIVQENEHIKAYLSRRDAWVEENDRIISERRVLKSDGVQKLGQVLEAQRVDEREKESLLHELHEGRQTEIDKIKERQILEREIRKRLDFRRCNEIALDYKAKLKAKEKAEDEAWKSMIMAEAEKEAKLEQMGQQRRRMKMLELKKEADRLLTERQQAREADKMEEKLYWQEHRLDEIQKESLIEEERQKLLREHAHKLIGFLPIGVLSEEDLERLGRDDINLLYKSRQKIDPLEQIEQQYSSKTNY